MKKNKRNNKGQVTLVILLTGFIVMSLIATTALYNSTMLKRGHNYESNKQLSELTEGAVYYTMEVLNQYVDFNKSESVANQVRYDFRMANGSKSTFYSDVSLYTPQSAISELRKKYTNDTVYNEKYAELMDGISSKEKIEIFKDGDFSTYLAINTAENLCFDITWTPGTEVSLSVYKVEQDKNGNIVMLGGQPKRNLAQPVISSTTGKIGNQTDDCSNETDHDGMVKADVIYNVANPSANGQNGYGIYEIEINSGGAAQNLQTRLNYYRLINRTFEIKAKAEVEGKVKENTSVIVTMSYPSIFEKDGVASPIEGLYGMQVEYVDLNKNGVTDPFEMTEDNKFFVAISHNDLDITNANDLDLMNKSLKSTTKIIKWQEGDE